VRRCLCGCPGEGARRLSAHPETRRKQLNVLSYSASRQAAVLDSMLPPSPSRTDRGTCCSSTRTDPTLRSPGRSWRRRALQTAILTACALHAAAE
jgi:hypothetical protein